MISVARGAGRAANDGKVGRGSTGGTAVLVHWRGHGGFDHTAALRPGREPAAAGARREESVRASMPPCCHACLHVSMPPCLHASMTLCRSGAVCLAFLRYMWSPSQWSHLAALPLVHPSVQVNSVHTLSHIIKQTAQYLDSRCVYAQHTYHLWCRGSQSKHVSNPA